MGTLLKDYDYVGCILVIVIYHDIGGTHSSCVAANIHLNRLPMDSIPDKSEILKLPTFDHMQKKDWGHLIFIGEDEFGYKVYTVCRQFVPNIIVPAVTDIYNIVNGSTKGLYMVNTTPTVNTWMGIGGYSSRRMGLVWFGRPIVTFGTLKAYKGIAKLVGEVKDTIRKDMQN